jgi:hypothetical protein
MSILRILLTLCPLAFSQSAATVSLSGKVVSSLGQPVSGAIVTASRTSAVPWTSSHTSSGSDGSFAFSSLAPGTYQFCVQVLAGGYLNPCNWSLTPPPAATVAAGNPVTDFQLTIPVGSLLQIQVNDPNNIAASVGSTGPPAQLMMGVHTSKGVFEPTIFRSTDAIGAHHYDVTIPFDTAINFEILNGNLQIAQSNGTPVSAPVGVQHSSTATGTPPVLVFQVTGTTP